jgi:hypothetical protein
MKPVTLEQLFEAVSTAIDGMSEFECMARVALQRQRRKRQAKQTPSPYQRRVQVRRPENHLEAQ